MKREERKIESEGDRKGKKEREGGRDRERG